MHSHKRGQRRKRTRRNISYVNTRGNTYRGNTYKEGMGHMGGYRKKRRTRRIHRWY